MATKTEKKSYFGDVTYMSLRSKMYLVTDVSKSDKPEYYVCLVNSDLPSDDLDGVDVRVTLTDSAVSAFRFYTMSPDELVNLFAYLCLLSGKNIVKP